MTIKKILCPVLQTLIEFSGPLQHCFTLRDAEYNIYASCHNSWKELLDEL